MWGLSKCSREVTVMSRQETLPTTVDTSLEWLFSPEGRG